MAHAVGYSKTQIRLHWAIAVLIALQVILGFGISDAFDTIIDGGAFTPSPLVIGHVLGGFAIFVFGLWRLRLRLRRGVPAAPAGTPRLQALAADAVHYILYAIMIMAPISGSIAWFGGIEQLGESHSMVKPVIIGLVALHVAAALYHHFIKKDRLLLRMMRAED